MDSILTGRQEGAGDPGQPLSPLLDECYSGNVFDAALPRLTVTGRSTPRQAHWTKRAAVPVICTLTVATCGLALALATSSRHTRPIQAPPIEATVPRRGRAPVVLPKPQPSRATHAASRRGRRSGRRHGRTRHPHGRRAERPSNRRVPVVVNSPPAPVRSPAVIAVARTPAPSQEAPRPTPRSTPDAPSTRATGEFGFER